MLLWAKGVGYEKKTVLRIEDTFTQLKELGNDHSRSLLPKPSPNLELIVNQFNIPTPKKSN